MRNKITEKDIQHAIRTCNWRITINGQRNLHVCRGACNICEKLIEDGKCDTLQRLFRQYDKEHGYQGKMLTIEVGESECSYCGQRLDWRATEREDKNNASNN